MSAGHHMMSFKIRNTLKWGVFIGAALLSVSTFTHADSKNSVDDVNAYGFRQLSGEQMMAAFTNKTLEAVYAEFYENGKASIIPVTFTETHHANATTTYEHRGEDVYTSTGIYTFQKDNVCYLYTSPEALAGKFCFYVFERDNCYYHFINNSPPPQSKKDFDRWTYMAYRHEDTNTCLQGIA